MAKVTVTVKVHDLRLKLFVNAVKLVSYISPNKANKMIEWVFDNVDKFYTIKW